jgi:hypothetical protein
LGSLHEEVEAGRVDNVRTLLNAGMIFCCVDASPEPVAVHVTPVL